MEPAFSLSPDRIKTVENPDIINREIYIFEDNSSRKFQLRSQQSEDE